MTGHNLHARLENMEKEIKQELTRVDKAKRQVFSDEVPQAKQYFLDNGYTAESIVEIEERSKLYYLIIGRKQNA
jgi:hypothetical protein